MAYLLVTLVIELRAGKIYSLYERTRKELGSPISLKSIISEEKRHLQEIDEILHREFAALDIREIIISDLCLAEDEIYADWLATIARELRVSQLSAATISL